MDILWDIMVNIITDALDVLCPWISIRIRKDQPRWFDGEINCLTSCKRQQYATACTSNDTLDWEQLKVYKRLVRTKFNCKKRSFIVIKYNENKNAPKKFWKEIQKNLHFGKDTTNSSPITVKAPNGTTISGLTVVDPMNEYYAQAGENLAAEFTKSWALPAVRPIVYNIQFMNFRFVDFKKITALINAMNGSKSSELYSITTKHLKDALKILIVEFFYLIKLCL